jgi:hypothetical protein
MKFFKLESDNTDSWINVEQIDAVVRSGNNIAIYFLGGNDIVLSFNKDKQQREDAIEKIADFFKKEVFPKVRKKEPELLSKIKMKVRSQEMKESFLREAEKDDDEKSLKDRKANRKEKAMIGGGLGTMGAGMIASLGEFMGYSDFEMTSFLHDLNHMAGLERYTGPITVAMVFAGLGMALKGVANRYDRTGK